MKDKKASIMVLFYVKNEMKSVKSIELSGGGGRYYLVNLERKNYNKNIDTNSKREEK